MMARRGGPGRNKSGITFAVFALLLLLVPGARAATTQQLPVTGNTGSSPQGIALDSDGNIYTANLSAQTVSKILADGNLSGGVATWINGGAQGVNVNGGIGLDGTGNLFVIGSNGVLGKFLPAGTAAGSPWPAAVGTDPDSIAVDPIGNLYVANLAGDNVSKITPGGQSPAGWPVTVGDSPDAIALDSIGNVFTANSVDGLATGTVSKVTPSGTGVPLFGSTGVQPSGITTDDAGNVYTANCGTASSGSVTRITSSGSSVPAWASIGAGTCPRAITIDSAGNLYTANNVSDSISRVTPAGAVTQLALTGDQPVAITIDADGNLYTADAGVNRVTKVIPVPADGVAPAPPATPGAPTATAGVASATVTIAANSASARFGTPSSYTVEAVQDSARTCTVTPPATSCQVAGLTPGTTYTFVARSNLNAWQTGASVASNSVTPSAPAPSPDPTPTPTPTPEPSLKVTGLKSTVSKKAVSLSSKATVSGAGRISQTAREGGKTWCSTSRSASSAGTYSLSCSLGKKARSAVRAKSLKLSVTTTFKPQGRSPISRTSRVTIARKR